LGDPNVCGSKRSLFLGSSHGMDVFLMRNAEITSTPLWKEMFNDENRAGRYAIGRALREYISNYLLNGDPNTKDKSLPTWEAWKPHKDHSKSF
jgi:hypothetical protein